MPTELERLVVSLEASTVKYERALAKAQGVTEQRMRGIERRTRAAGLAVTSNLDRALGTSFNRLLVPAVAIASFERLAASIAETVHNAAGLVDLADKIGITTDALQELRFQAEQEGSSAEALNSILEQFSKRIGLAAAGQGDLLKILQANNIALRDAAGNLRPLTELLADYADLIKNAKNDQDAAVLSVEAFGKAGDEAANIFRSGAAGISQFADQAHRANQVVGEEGLRTLESYDDRLSELSGRWNKFWTEATVFALQKLEQIGQAEHLIIDPLIGLGQQLAPEIQSAFDPAPVQVLQEQIASTEATLAHLQSLAATGVIVNTDEATAALAFLRAQLSALGGDSGPRVLAGSGRGGGGGGGRGQSNVKPTVIPKLGGGSGGGGKSPAKQFEDDVERLHARTAAIAAETAVVGKSIFEQERAAAVQDLINQAKADGIKNIDALLPKINAEAEAYAKASELLEQTQQAHEDMLRMQQFVGDELTDVFTGIVTGSEKAGDALKRLAADFAEAAIRAALLGQGPLAALFGGSPAGGGVGGIFGKLGGIFGGGRADGGPVSPGHVYRVGERGPETFVPTLPGRIVPKDGYGGGTQRVETSVKVEPSPLFHVLVDSRSRQAEERAIARGPLVARDQQRRRG